MIYEIITIENPMNGSTQDHIQISNKDGSFESFPVDKTNSRYVQFLAQLEQEK